ncbi:MAG: tetratricopeptide repeat protein, partial [Candidatus Aegiribacteria sp.]|nr:tetratricopeptide repeat protein [Candidatus Aegiribacteria sp.]
LADSIIAEGDSLDAQVWFWRGKALTEKNQWTEAAESFYKVFEIGPAEDMVLNEYWFTFFNSAANNMNDGDLGAAQTMLERGMEVAPERPDFNLMLGDMELNVNGDRAQALDNYRSAADKAEQLVADLQELVNSTDDQWELDYYAQSLDQAEAIEIQAMFNTGSVLTMMAMSAEDSEREQYLQQAEEMYIKGLEVDATNVDMLDALAGIYLLEEDYSQAMDIFDQALESIETGVAEGWLEEADADDLTANIYVSKGYAYIEMEEYQNAIDDLNTARELVGDDYAVLATLAHAHFVMEDYQESLANLDAVLAIQGLDAEEFANAYYTKYACYNRLEQDEEAAEALETALEFQPDNAEYWRYLASTYSRLGRRNEAIEAMEKAEELSSE